MIAGPTKINRLIQEASLVSGLPEGYEAKGLSVDLRLDKIYQHCGCAILSQLRRQTGSNYPLGDARCKPFQLRPQCYYLARTIETVRMPDNLAAICIPRSTAFRAGFHIGAGFVDPGYEGAITFGIANLAPKISYIEHGFALIQICFFKADEAAELYNGIYQGGAIAAS